MTNYSKIMADAKQFVSDNLVDLSQELIQFHKTSLLPDGKLRTLANMLNAVAAGQGIPLAETLINCEAINQAAAGRKRIPALEVATKEQVEDASWEAKEWLNFLGNNDYSSSRCVAHLSVTDYILYKRGLARP